MAAVAVLGVGLMVDVAVGGEDPVPAHPAVRVDTAGGSTWLGVVQVTASPASAAPSSSPSPQPSGDPSPSAAPSVAAPGTAVAGEPGAPSGPTPDAAGGSDDGAPAKPRASSASPRHAASATPSPTPVPKPKPAGGAQATASAQPEVTPYAQQPEGAAAIEADIFTATNAQRAAFGLPALRSSSCATAHVQGRVAQLVAEREFYHPPLEPVVEDCQAGAGENLALGSRTGAGVVDAWMNSTGHRANLLDPEYTTMGMSCQRQDEYWLCGAVYLMPVDAG